MQKAEVIHLAVRPGLTLLVDGKPYQLEFPLSAVILAEEKLGRSLKSPQDWFTAGAKDIPALLEAGLSKHHDVTPEEIQEICDRLDPEAYAEVAQALGAIAFPRFTARYMENLEKMRAAAARGEPGKAPSVAVP